MKRLGERIMIGVAIAGLAAGCRTGAQVKEIARADLNLVQVGNRGYIHGTPPPVPVLETTREILELNIEVPRFFGRGPAEDPAAGEVAGVFLNECRDIDIIGRFTESTFMVLMPGTGAAGSEILARRMLDGVRQRGESGGVAGSPSAGLATMPAAGIHNRHAFLARAEACLRLAREGQGQEGFCSYSE